MGSNIAAQKARGQSMITGPAIPALQIMVSILGMEERSSWAAARTEGREVRSSCTAWKEIREAEIALV